MYFLKTNLYGERGLDMKKHKYSIRIFQCPECHNKMYAAKGSAVKTSSFARFVDPGSTSLNIRIHTQNV